MKEVNIISFDQLYLDQLLVCWNKALLYDPINKERFIELVLLDDNFDASLMKLAIVNGECIGFCYGIKRKVPYLERGLEPERGYISIMGVTPPYQNKGIGEQLLQAVESTLIERGVKNITLCAYSPNYFFPGIDVRYDKAISFFEKHGYTLTSEAVSMQRDLWDYTMPNHSQKKLQLLQNEGIEIIPYEEKYLSRLLEFLLENFGAGWKRNALNAMQKKEAEKTILLCLNKESEIIGFCMRKIDGNDSRFGPIGVSENLRSKGLGGVLLDYMMLDMKKRGIEYIYFLWTSGAAQRFYARHDFHVYRSYKLYRKELSL